MLKEAIASTALSHPEKCDCRTGVVKPLELGPLPDGSVIKVEKEQNDV